MTILQKAVYMFNGIPIKILMIFITKFEVNPKVVHLEVQKTTNNRAILNKKSNTEDIIIPDLKLYYIAIKTA
jgi:hypothetical protein